MRVSKPFVVFKRQLPSGIPVYYYTARTADGRRTTARSTGKTTKSAAERYCMGLLKEGRLIPRKETRFKDYTIDWWDYDRCAYIQRKLKTRGRFSPSYAASQRSILLRYIKPTFDKYLMSEITTNDIELWRASLGKSYRLSNLTMNHILANLKVIMHEACRCQIIDRDPALAVTPYRVDSKEKGILTRDEALRLFKPENAIEVWKGDATHIAINMLAMAGGLRQGEILALKVADLRADEVRVNHSWDRKAKQLGLPKNGKPRTVPLSEPVMAMLRTIADQNGAKTREGFLFPNKRFNGPLDHKVLLGRLYAAMRKIGISEEDRRNNNITFHSWRHFNVTYMRSEEISDLAVRLYTGHCDVEMQDHYSHLTEETASSIRKAQLRLFKTVA